MKAMMWIANKMTRLKEQKIKGSLFIEYVCLIAIVVGAVLAMSAYFKSAICGRWKQSADSFGYGLQYEPGKTQITVTKEK